MKHVLAVFVCSAFCLHVFAQDVNVTLKEAVNLERQLKDGEAVEKYQQVAAADPKNIPVLVKCAEIYCNTGSRQLKRADKENNYLSAQQFAAQALSIDSNSADANYAMALVLDKSIELETKNERILDLERKVKTYTNKALALNAGHARANFLDGKWNFDMLNISLLKKAEAKTLFKKFPDPDIDSAIFYMEKCRTLEQYFAPNYLILAKAYKFKNRPAQAIEVLNKLVKLPTRTPNDVVIKAEGQQILSEMQ
jgi:tetratricopeptide (TPR) repeat protein